jgi:hypothetical protein
MKVSIPSPSSPPARKSACRPLRRHSAASPRPGLVLSLCCSLGSRFRAVRASICRAARLRRAARRRPLRSSVWPRVRRRPNPGNDDLTHLPDLCAEKPQIDIHYEPGQLTGVVAPQIREGLSDPNRTWRIGPGVARLHDDPDERGALTVVELARESPARLEPASLRGQRQDTSDPTTSAASLEDVLRDRAGARARRQAVGPAGPVRSCCRACAPISISASALAPWTTRPAKRCRRLRCTTSSPHTVPSVALLTSAVTSVHGVQLRAGSALPGQPGRV